MTDDGWRITYTGPVHAAAAVERSLSESGLEVIWTPPTEQRGLETMSEAVVVYYFCQGTDAVVRAAVNHVRERLRGRATIDVERHSPKPKHR